MFYKTIIILTVLHYTTAENIMVTTADVHKDIDKWATTKVKVKKMSCAWTIDNLSYCDKTLLSPIFTADFDDNIKWQLELRPNGVRKVTTTTNTDRYNNYYYTTQSPNYDKKDYIGLHLTIVSGSNDGPLKINFSLVNENNELIITKEAYENSFYSGTSIGYETLIKDDLLKSLLVNDKLTIIAQIGMNIGYANSSGSCIAKNTDESDYVHTDIFENLLDDEIFNDVKIICKEREFKAHRAILASVSSVFSELFKQQKETNNSTDVYHVGDIQPSVFKEFLRFVYTGKVNKINSIAKELLLLADTYNVEHLKTMCEKALCSSLSSDNYLELFQYASRTNSTSLKKQALKYISMHAEKLIETPGFLKLISEPSLVVSVMRSLINDSTD